MPREIDRGGAERGSPKIVIHNPAQAGDALRQDIRQLHRLPVRPQILLLYTGHNELYRNIDEVTRVSDSPVPKLDRLLSRLAIFGAADAALTSRFSSLWRLRQMGRRLVDEPYLTAGKKAARLEVFGQQLRQLAEFCQRQNIQCIWYVPAASEADCPPNRSVLAKPPTTDDRERIQELEQQVRRFEEQQDWRQAAAALTRGLQRHPEFAEFQYRLGHSLRHLQRYDQAADCFRAALELDAFPVRAQLDHRQQIVRIAAEHGIPTVNASAVLSRLQEHGIVDRALVLDDVHPNLRATYTLGTESARILWQRLNADQPLPRDFAVGSFRETLDHFSITPQILANAYTMLAGVMLHRARLRFDESHWLDLEQRLTTAAAALQSLDVLPDDSGIESLINLSPAAD